MSQSLRKILVVDDDEDIVLMLETVLGQSYDVLVARDGASAIDAIAAHGLSAVIADHMLPGATGVELLDRTHDLQPAAARVLITASDRVNVLKDAVNRARVHRFLSKPLRLMELPTLVGDAIREAGLEAENQRLVAELSIKNAELARINERLEVSELLLP